MRIAILGDVGGHRAAFEHLLTSSLQIDIRAAVLPEDLVVVQVGDLVHRGPDSAGVVRLVARLIASNGPDRWVQLLGNHEAVYAGEARWRWPDQAEDDTMRLLDAMWDTQAMRLAVGVQVERVISPSRAHDAPCTSTGPLLITHAGLTAGCWRAIGSPAGLSDAVAAIARGWNQPLSPVWERGEMMTGRLSHRAGVLWASTGEVHDSWASVPMPWSQAHGHIGARRTAGKWRWPLDEVRRNAGTRERLAAWDDLGITRVETSNGSVVWGVDPGHGARQTRPWGALVVAGELVG